MKLFEILIKKLRSTLLLVETYDGWDGSNVRIIVKVKNDDIVAVSYTHLTLPTTERV